MPLQAWSKFEFFDMDTGEMAVRYSAFSGHGEFWMKLPMTKPGQSRRQQQEWVLTLLNEAIEDGQERGEVEYRRPSVADVKPRYTTSPQGGYHGQEPADRHDAPGPRGHEW
jgi:hypothetical protein